MLGVVVGLAIVAGLMAPFTVGSAQPRPAVAATTATHSHRFTNVPIRGTTATGGTFVGTLDVRRFGVFNGAMKAVGTLDGKVLNSSGKVVGKVLDRGVRVPVASINGTSTGTHQASSGTLQASSCTILRLVLGPIHLNLLGLHVDTNRIVINISAEPCPGNLLGNLLCAIAHLLDRTNVQGILARLLTVVTRFVNGLQQLT